MARQISIHTPKTIVPVVLPEGRIVFYQWEANIGIPCLEQGRDGKIRVRPEDAERGTVLLADLYKAEKDEFRREEGRKFIANYIKAWRGPNPDSVAGVEIPDHLLPREVVDRRAGRAKTSVSRLEVPPDPKAKAKNLQAKDG